MLLTQLAENPYWFWLGLGGLLLVLELLGAGGYLLWAGISAVLISLFSWLLPLGWPWQAVGFSLLTLLTAWLWWYWLQNRRHNASSSPLLNQRSQQLIGRQFTLNEPLVNGQGRLKIGDGSWRASAAEDIPIGSLVEIIEVDGIELKIRWLKPVNP